MARPAQTQRCRMVGETLMRMIVYADERGVWFMLVCPCGFGTSDCATLEAAGREADLHMAEKFPRGSERRPCDAD